MDITSIILIIVIFLEIIVLIRFVVYARIINRRIAKEEKEFREMIDKLIDKVTGERRE